VDGGPAGNHCALLFFFNGLCIYIRVNGGATVSHAAVTFPRFYESGWALAAIIIVLFTRNGNVSYIQQNFRRQLVQAP